MVGERDGYGASARDARLEGALGCGPQLQQHDLSAIGLEGQLALLQSLGVDAEHIVAPPLHGRHVGRDLDGDALQIVAIGDQKEAKKVALKAEAASKAEQKPAARAKETAEATADQHQAGEVAGTPTENPAPNNDKAAGAEKPAAKKAAPAKAEAESGSTKNAAPAKGGAKKSPKAK